MFELLDADGYTSAVVVSSELVQLRPLVLGDLVRSTIMLESVSEQKSTALGAAHFVTTRQDFLVEDEPVGHSRFTVMKFRPAATPAGRRPRRPNRLRPLAHRHPRGDAALPRSSPEPRGPEVLSLP